MTARPVDVVVDGRQLKLSNLDKVLWPEAGFTKGQMIEYYAKVAPVMVEHLRGRPITFRRYPDGVEGPSFFEKNCPSYHPEWMPTVALGDTCHCRLEEPAALVWAANLAAIELHPGLARHEDLGRPDFVVFDLDPGPGADVVTCAEVALLIKDVLGTLGLRLWAKTSGSKGLQVYAPLDGTATYDWTREFSRAVAALIEKSRPDLVVTTQAKAVRPGKVLIDWSQNSLTKTTIGVYSLRARARPTVSTPVTWEEVTAALEAGDGARLVFETAAVLERLDSHGDLMAPMLTARQQLPALKGLAALG